MAAVIGTLLSLLVFMSLFGLFLTQFVPLWMTDNERQLSETVAQQLANVKWCEDTLAITSIAYRVCSAPVTLQSQSIPVFTQPTQATLSFQRLPSIYTNVTFNDTEVAGAPTIHGNYFQNVSQGEIDVALPDRYYAPITYELTGGAVVSTQGGDHQVMVFPPSIVAVQTGTAVNLSMTLYAMYGNVSEVNTVPSTDVYVSYIAGESYTDAGTAVEVNMSTEYPCAWQSFFESEFKGSGVSPTVVPASCPTTIQNGEMFKMHIYFTTVTLFTLTIVDFDIETGIGNPT